MPSQYSHEKANKNFTDKFGKDESKIPAILRENFSDTLQNPLPQALQIALARYESAYSAHLNNLAALKEEESKPAYVATIISGKQVHADYLALCFAYQDALRAAHGNVPFFSDDASSHLILTADDFSDASLARIAPSIQTVLEAASGEFSHELMSQKLAPMSHQPISASGINEGASKDYGRTDFLLQGEKTPPISENDEPDRHTEEEVGAFCARFLAQHPPIKNGETDSPQKSLMALISTLAYQSGLPYFSLMNLKSNLAAGDATSLECARGMGHITTISFDQDKPQIHITYYRHTDMALSTGGCAFDNLVTYQKAALTIGVEYNANNQPQFSMLALEGRLSVICPYERTAENNPYTVRADALKTTNGLPAQYIDTLTLQLDGLARMLGFDSVPHYYEQTNRTESNAEKNAYAAAESALAAKPVDFLRNVNGNIQRGKVSVSEENQNLLNLLGALLIDKETVNSNSAIGMLFLIKDTHRNKPLFKAVLQLDKDVCAAFMEAYEARSLWYQIRERLPRFLGGLPKFTHAERAEITRSFGQQEITLERKNSTDDINELLIESAQTTTALLHPTKNKENIPKNKTTSGCLSALKLGIFGSKKPSEEPKYEPIISEGKQEEGTPVMQP